MNSPLIETAVDEARSLSSHSTNRRTPSSIETVGFQPSRCFAASRLKTGRVEGYGLLVKSSWYSGFRSVRQRLDRDQSKNRGSLRRQNEKRSALTSGLKHRTSYSPTPSLIMPCQARRWPSRAKVDRSAWRERVCSFDGASRKNSSRDWKRSARGCGSLRQSTTSLSCNLAENSSVEDVTEILWLLS